VSAVFTITQQTPVVFTATVVQYGLTVNSTTQPFTVSEINPSFTATLYRSTISVADSTLTNVAISVPTPQVFTGTFVTNVFTATENIFNVTATTAVTTVTIAQTTSPISVTYNPTLVSHVYDGQPVYTTSSVTFRQLTLGNTSTFTFPADDGEYGLALLTDGNGQLFWGGGGGGGELITWNLNSDLVTNGFKIKSNSTAVDLTILGGLGQVKLDSTGTFISHTGTGALVFEAGGTTRLTSGSKGLTFDSNATLNVDSNTFLQLATTSTQIKSAKIVFSSTNITIGSAINGTTTLNGTLNISNDLAVAQDFSARDVTADRQFISDLGFIKRIEVNTLTNTTFGYINVPPLRFADGSILYGPGTVSTNTISLTGPLYTNDNPIKSNTSVGTLTLQQGNSLIEISNDPSNESDIFMQVGPSAKPTEGGGSIYFDTSTVYGSRLSISVGEFVLGATTSTFNTQPRFNNGIKFADGTTTSTNNRNLDSLSDVEITSPTLNQVLKYDGTKWYNGTDASSGTGSQVLSVIAGPGIAVSAPTGDVTITNVGVRSVTASNGLVASASTGEVSLTIGNLPIQPATNRAITVDTSTFGTTKIGVDLPELWTFLEAGNGITLTQGASDNYIRIGTTATSVALGGDLFTLGYDINGANNQLDIFAGQVYIGTETRQSIISMPVNTDMRIYSDYGIVIDTPDDESVQITSPFTVSHRNGASRISTDAIGQTRLNDAYILVTATNRIVLNSSVIKDDSVKFQLAAGNAYIEVQGNTSTIAGQTVVIASTGTTKIGPNIYQSKLGVQDITNWNDTGPFTASKGIQFNDLSVQLTAYQGFLNFGTLGSPATRPDDFFLQLLNVDFGTITAPSALSYDAGVLS
jgi:hypothetical protein